MSERWRNVGLAEGIERFVAAERRLGRFGLVTPGCSEKEIGAFEKRAGAMPRELRELYKAARPARDRGEMDDDEEGNGLRLLAVGDEEMRWCGGRRPLEWVKSWPREHLEALGLAQSKQFVFGTTDFGDVLFIAEGMPGRADGAVMMFQHDSEPVVMQLADSLGCWLARVSDFELFETFYMAGEDEELQEAARGVEVAREYERLNEPEEWTREVIEGEERGGGGAGVRFWDESSRRFLTPAEGAELERARFENIAPFDLDALAPMKKLTWLDLSHCRFASLEPLTRLARLGWVRIFGEGEAVDVSPLRGLETLDRLEVQGCEVVGLHALSGHPKLRWIQLGDAGEEVRLRELRELASLEYLGLNACRADGIPDLSTMPRIKDLALGRGTMEDLSFLLAAPGLQAVAVHEAEVGDYSALLELPRLKTVYAFGKLRDGLRELDRVRVARPDIEWV